MSCPFASILVILAADLTDLGPSKIWGSLRAKKLKHLGTPVTRLRPHKSSRMYNVMSTPGGSIFEVCGLHTPSEGLTRGRGG
jgi:hypothetical protein